MQWGFTFYDPALPVLSSWTLVSFCNVDMFNKDTLIFSVDLNNLADFSFILAGNDLDFVVLF
jgi:hypothetical protein